MKYGLIGEDHETPEEKIEKFTGEVPWRYLRPHFKTGSLLWVDPELDLTEVARAFQEDDSVRVADWLGKGDLVKVGELHAEQWEKGDGLFTAVVVSPFVLMREAR